MTEVQLNQLLKQKINRVNEGQLSIKKASNVQTSMSIDQSYVTTKQ